MKLRVISFLLLVFTVVAISGYSPAYADEKMPTAFEKAEVKPALFVVARFVVAKDVQDREPVDATDIFPSATDKVYCFLEAKDIIEETNVECVWYLNGTQMRVSSLTLSKGSRWRTYANKSINGQRGDWKVDLRDANGTVLKSVSFKVE